MSKDNLIPTIDLDSPSADNLARPNPMIWEGEEEAQGVFVGASSTDDALALLGVPTLEVLRLPEDFEPSPELRAWLSSLQDAVATVAAGNEARKMSFEGLADLDIQAVEEILGEGEVDGRVTLDGIHYTIRESLLAGVWRVSGDDGARWVEVAEAPSVATTAAASLQPAHYEIPAPTGNVMNAPAVLAEIGERARAWRDTGEPNHVLNFTLLPMSEADHELLTAVLGRADLELRSGGFGDCRIMATRYRHVWAVQFVNAMDHTILDTVEIGHLPAAARAQREDFEDSGERLAELMETYLT